MVNPESPKFLPAQVIEAPLREFEPRTHNLFLLGGITNCPDWQQEMISKLIDLPDLNIFNPRRKNFPIHDPNAASEQIKWEHDFIRDSNIRSIWFSGGSLNPIVLYELGRWINSDPTKPVFIGVDPKYQRTQDVRIQTMLDRPEIEIVTSLNDLAEQIKDYIKSTSNKKY